MAVSDPVTGFYGKITSHGDFVSRRMPADFVSVWDHWLQTVLHGSRAQLGERWLATYLNSPIWRFALAPGVCDDKTWAGIVMPSIDRVGRHFPLTIAAGVTGQVPLLDWLDRSAGWYAELETLALSTLDAGADFVQFDAAVQAMVAPAFLASEPAAALHMPITSVDALPLVLPALAHTLANAALAGQGVWWTDGSTEVVPSLHVWRGLPSIPTFSGMLDGNWGELITLIP
ncbi:MAG: type VI secretion system protein ImpM [Burkholderiaceae bacterium]|jgi:type VI secretion system protein ImpM